MFPDIGQTSLFAGMALSLIISIIFLTGMFPVASRLQNMQRSTGSLMVLLCALTTLILSLALISTAISVQWPFLVVAGGLAFLIAPMIYQAFPPTVSEGPAGALSLISANSILIWIGASQAGLV